MIPPRKATLKGHDYITVEQTVKVVLGVMERELDRREYVRRESRWYRRLARWWKRPIQW